jgi:hypothetical protein
MTTMARPVFSLRVQAAEPDVDVIRSLRSWLKSGLRNFGLRCLEIYQESTSKEGVSEMPIDLRNTDPQRSARETIPAGPYVLEIEVRGGSADRGDCLRWAKNRRTLLLELEYTVIGGEHHGHSFRDYISVDYDESDKDDAPPLDRGKVKDFRANVRMGRSRVRAIIDSVYGLDPNDHSPSADAKRQIEGYESLDGLRFCGQVIVEKGEGKYGPRNILDFVLTAGLPDYVRPPAKSTGQAVVRLKRTGTDDGTFRSSADDMNDEIPDHL